MHYRGRLRKMVCLRMDSRLSGRVDPSDVLQEAYIEIAKRAAENASNSEMPFFLWLRMMTGQKLLEVHRRHFNVQARDIRREISIHNDRLPEANSFSMAAQLLGNVSSPSLVARRAELQAKLQQILNEMDEIDREVVALRHFEELTNSEVAAVLELSTAAASNRYIRAIKRLRAKLGELPDLI